MAFILFLFHLLPLAFAGPENPSDPGIFRNCYRQFTRHLPAANDPLIRQIQEGKISAVSACMNLLSDFHLDPHGNLAPNNTGRAIDVLNTFHELHASWFRKNDFVYYGNDCQLDSLQEIQDVTAPALYFDFSLFDDSHKDAGYIVDSRDSLFPLRSETENDEAYFASHQDLLAFGEGTEVFGRKFFGFRGRLLGIAKEGPDVRIKTVMPLEKGAAPGKDVPLYRSLGPGFTGHPAYLLRSGLRPPGRYATKDSPAFILASHMIHDLLCLDKPQLKEEDVAPTLDTSSHLPFKHDARCMGCHATLYSVATVFRNFGVAASSNSCRQGEDQNALAVYRFAGPEPEGSPGIPFHRTRPEGKLFYRNYLGNLVSAPVQNLEQFAANIKNSPQFYYCSARRYFEFLTGLEVAAHSPRGPAVARFLREVTDEYMKHRKPKKLVESILKSEFYR